jgi:hypothetical protein
MVGSLRTQLKSAALVALLAFSGAFAEAASIHTDDGCPVELHCLACRLTLGTLAVAAPPAIPLAVDLIDLGAPPLAPAQPVLESAPRAVAPRGPPLA